MERRYYKVESIAEYLSVSIAAIRKWIRLGKIPFSRLNGAIRFDIQEIDIWAGKNRVKCI